MNVCGITRLLVPAFLVGLAVATFAGNDGYGWIAAGLTAGGLYVVQWVRGSRPACPISPSTHPVGSAVPGDDVDPFAPR